MIDFKISVYKIQCLNIQTDHYGISCLLAFYHYAYKFEGAKIMLDLSCVTHINANLSALILALIEKLFKERNVRVYINLGRNTDVFHRNGLLGHLNGFGNVKKIVDSRMSTIPLRKFDPNDAELFCSYLNVDFFNHRGLAKIHRDLKKRLRTNYIEVFNNVELHAKSNYCVFCCGQYFPSMKILKFTLVDLGVGFLSNVRRFTNGQIDDDNSAIIWSTQLFNSTKNESFGTGGSGLKDIIRFCKEYNGVLNICSGNGFVQISSEKTQCKQLMHHFPGSIINIIINNI